VAGAQFRPQTIAPCHQQSILGRFLIDKEIYESVAIVAGIIF
jgi:hypothetical protein